MEKDVGGSALRPASIKCIGGVNLFKSKKRPVIFLAIALVVCLVGSILASCVQSGFGKVHVENYNNLTLTEISEKIAENNAASGKDIAVSFTPSATMKMTYKVLIPKNATKETPAPAVILMHGGLSNKDTTAPVFIELARRGFVVIAFDAMGHGKTDKGVDALTHNTMGMEAMVELAMSMSCVDETQVGVTGHSWGNNGAAAVINAINLNTENPRIAAFLCAQGSLAVYDLQPGAMDGVTFGFSAGKYDEMDVTYFNSHVLPSTPFAISWIQEVYPQFSESEVPLGIWFDECGGHELQEGTKFDGVEGRVMYNPENTHPAALFSTTGVGTNINFFYGAFGTPTGAKYISSGSQIWGVYIAFLVIALAGWFMLALALFDLLLCTPMFQSLRGSRESLVVADRDSLPSFRNAKESVPLVVMFVLLTAFSYLTLLPCTMAGAKLIPSSKFFPNAAHTSSALGYWSFITAVVALVAIYIVSQVKCLLNRKDEGYVWQNPLAVAKTGFGKVVQSAILAFVIFGILHLFLYAVDEVLSVDYVIATIDFTTFRPVKIFVMFRYLILCAPFYIVNAILNANTRFKDLPEWVSTGIVCLGSVLGLIIFLIKEYSTLFSTGALATPDACSTCTVIWAMLVPLVVGPIIARYTYKRTGNIWVGALLNSFLFIMMQVGTGQYMIESIDITMFGL